MNLLTIIAGHQSEGVAIKEKKISDTYANNNTAAVLLLMMMMMMMMMMMNYLFNQNLREINK